VIRERFLFQIFIPILCIALGVILRRTTASVPVVRSENFQNIVELTPNARQLTRQIRHDRRFPNDTGLRILINTDKVPPFEIKFDLPTDDDSDWIGESDGIFVMIKKTMALQLRGLAIDASNGEFVFSMRQIAS
jgi:Fe-S cluster assembly iron-binding protein IscA